MAWLSQAACHYLSQWWLQICVTIWHHWATVSWVASNISSKLVKEKMATWYLDKYDIIELINKGTLLWRHNGRDGVSNHQLHDCLLNRSSSRRSKKISKLRVTGLCAGNSPGTGEFLAQMASNAENVSMWWHYHEKERRLILKSRGRVKFLLMPTVPRAKTKNHSSILTNGS